MEDPRCNTRNQVDYSLNEMLFLVISAVISGMTEWKQIALFGEKKLDWLRKFFPYENGTPCSTTIGRLFAQLDHQAFGQYFIEWVATLSELTKGEIVAIDGKTMRGSANPDDNKLAIHVVSAFVCHQSICLGQVATDQKSNEITAIPKLLDLLTLQGCTVTIDAMGCQKEISKKILEKKADYLLQVKKNQKGLLEQIEKVFQITAIVSSDTDNHVDHGRIEQRVCEVITDLTHLDGYQNWPGIESVIRLSAVRIDKKTGKVKKNIRYYISNKSDHAQVFNQDIRAHWGIENKLHWSLDVSFKEDSSKKRKGNSAENMGLFSKIALQMVVKKNEKLSKKNKMLNALLDDHYREMLLEI